MTDSMNFGPDWIRNLSSEGSTGGGIAGGVKYQLADYRYGREEMLALFDKNSKPPASLTNFKCIYSEQSLVPLALLPTTEEERGWQGRPSTLTGGPSRGRGGSLERGGRISRGRGYQYGRVSTYDVDQADWSPRKEYNSRTTSLENWRRAKSGDQEDDGWRGVGLSRGNLHEKWGRSTSWRGEGDGEDKAGMPDRLTRAGWGDTSRAPPGRKSWDEDNLPEWANENPTEGGGSFDDKGAFHGSDDELSDQKPMKREVGLQKSTSQQLISAKSQQPPPLSTSKSTASLIKSEDSITKAEDQSKEAVDPASDKRKETPTNVKRKRSIPNISSRLEKPPSLERVKADESTNVYIFGNGPIDLKGEDPDFERLQEDFVLKLMGDEELPKTSGSKFEVGGIQPPPNLIPPAVQDKWFYEDPQGQMQGPFANIEMAEWYKAGYFNNQLKVRRHCDERFFLLGELIAMCGDVNPFTSGIRFPILKNDVTKMPDPELLQFQYLSQLAAYKQAQARILQEPWSAITLQQQELAANRLMMQQQAVSQDLPFMQQSQATNPLMHMINQMQQANKLPNQPIVDKPPPTIPPALDPQFQIHMNNLLSMQNRMPTTNMTSSLPAGFTNNLSNPLPPENLASTVPGLPTTLALSGITPVSIGGSISIPRPTPHGSVDQITPAPDNDPISSLLKQLQQQKQQSQQIDSLWQQNQYNIPVTTSQWQTTKNEVPLSMWDVSQNKTPVTQVSSTVGPEKARQSPPQHPLPEVVPQEIETKEPKTDKEKEVKQKEEQMSTEKKKKKEQEEKVKKDAEERRKQDQRRQEAEKKAAEEKRRKEEEKIKKELEKAKKEAEDKRLRELEEKRRLKEQRKAEEEARKKSEESKKSEDEKLRKEHKEIEARQLAEEKRIQQELRTAKAAPWSQSNSTLGLSLADIQRAEKEKRAQETALQLQRLQEKEYQQQQQQQEKLAGLQLNWAKKPVEPRKVKSLSEIQAEEQERLAKQVAESRLQKEKEKELAPVINSTNSIWNGQNLSWANASATNSQWSSSGLWEEASHRHSISKPSNNFIKSNMSSSFNFTTKQSQQHQPAQKAKGGNKPKKEDAGKNATNHNNNNNNPAIDEFTNWCYSTLGNISTDIDIPTFVTFLRDIESAFDVREYCKDYLGDSNVTHQFASNFLEKRRLFKPRNNTHKDDMCSPAPAITPSSLQHSTEFQEVKGKNKKNKKSKMLKVDSRILGFNVTSAPDRINVGDRDYGDNS